VCQTPHSEPEPEHLGFDPERLARAKEVLERHISEGTTPGAVAEVCRRGGTVVRWAVGRHAYEADSSPVQGDDVFDLASLTKVVATATVCMVLEDKGMLDLDAPVAEQIPGFRGHHRERVTARHLLAHCGGLPAHVPFYRTCGSSEEILEAACAVPLESEPGTKTQYSDVGFLLLGGVLERVGRDSLDRLAQRLVLGPMGMDDTGYRPGCDLRERIPPTEWDREWRGRLVKGEVHDENAAAMGGVAPHAGLFGTAEDLGRSVRFYLCGGSLGDRNVLPEDGIRRYVSRACIVLESTRALGWDTVSEQGSSTGRHFSRHAYGHLGFTGTSVWADPERDLGVVLLTNRTYPTRDNQGIQRLRPEFHDAVAQAMMA
jgi:CubicO group peptidase (beta-lactamase class C family)